MTALSIASHGAFFFFGLLTGMALLVIIHNMEPPL
jgi:hypothetical protein